MFETLLWDCFTGPNRLESDGLSAAIRQVPEGTAVLSFRLDCPAFRKASGIGRDGKCCDGMLLVLRCTEPISRPVPALFLLEMKGCKLDDALEQLAATLDIIQVQLRSTLGDSYGRARFTAVVISDRVPPRPLQTQVRLFQQKFGAALYVRHATRRRSGADLTELLHRGRAD